MNQGSRTHWEGSEKYDKIQQRHHQDEINIMTMVPLTHSAHLLKKPTVLIFDHYLIIKLHYDEKEGDSKQEYKPVMLLIVDLSDDSVQEVAIKDKSWLFDQSKFDEAPYSLIVSVCHS